MLYDFWKKIKVSLLFNGHMTHMTVEHACHSIQYYDRWTVLIKKKKLTLSHSTIFPIIVFCFKLFNIIGGEKQVLVVQKESK